MTDAPRSKYELRNVVEHNRRYKTFQIPPAKDRMNIARGQFAKLVFEANDEGIERMWVEISDRLPDGSYRGKLKNHPATITLYYNDEVTFRPEHVCDIDGVAGPFQ